MSQKISFYRFDKEFYQVMTPLIGSLKKIYVPPQDDYNLFPNNNVIGLYVKKKDIKIILEGKLEKFPVFHILNMTLHENHLTLEAIFNEDVANIVADTICKGQKK